jgi:hypothetical protein
VVLPTPPLPLKKIVWLLVAGCSLLVAGRWLLVAVDFNL